jgi:hypothetical protein
MTPRHPAACAQRQPPFGLLPSALDDNGQFINAIEDKYPDLDFAELVALKQYVSAGEMGHKYFSEPDAKSALETSLAYARLRLQAYDLRAIVNNLFALFRRTPRNDVFGSYRVGSQVIHVYVVPCMIFGMVIEEDFADMAIGILAHELAHGLHHVGEDKDGNMWSGFGRATDELVESLAEYYAREFARHASGTRPGLLRAFDKTTPFLAREYRRYEEWEDRYSYEAVYQTLVTARRNYVLEFDDFTEILDETRHRLGRGIQGPDFATD